MAAETVTRNEGGVVLPALLWRFASARRAVSSAPLGGGIGSAQWVLNATVPMTYARTDPVTHLGEIAAGLGLEGPGVGMLTAVDVGDVVIADDGGVVVTATVGLCAPTWPAAPDGHLRYEGALPGSAPVGTINVVAEVPAPLSAGALVNVVTTASEAKAQALWEAGVEATGTATDAVAVTCPAEGEAEAFGGPRSVWGARLARAVHAAVREGTRRWEAGDSSWSARQAAAGQHENRWS